MKKATIKRKLKSIIAIFYRIGLKNKNFSIISNNCWGGVVYDKFALPYLTPTIGLWIPPKDFIKFCQNIDYYLNAELKQINYTESHVKKLLIQRKKEGRYDFDLNTLIIGRIDDIDIIFIHYNNFDDAKQKWDRRKKRINFDNLIIKLNDQNECTKENLNDFFKLNYKNKLFFTAKEKWCINKNCILIKKYIKDGYVVNDTTHGDVPINITNYLNSIK